MQLGSTVVRQKPDFDSDVVPESTLIHILVESRNIESAVLIHFKYGAVLENKAQTLANKIPARLEKTTGTTTTETSFCFGSKANVVVSNFYPYYTPHFCGEGCSSLIMPTSATKQRLV